MKRCICLILAFAIVPAVALATEAKPGEPTDSDAVKILKKLDAAAKAVKAVKYTVTAKGTGELAALVPELEGTFILVGYDAQGMAEKYLIEATVTLPGSSEKKKLTAGTDADMYFVVDHEAKKAYEDIDPAVMGNLGRNLLGGLMIEFVHPTPFADEINGKTQEITGSKMIGGEDCYEIHVVYANDQEATWYVSKKDFLPRARTDVRTLRDGRKGTMEKVITKLEVDPKVGDDTFKLKLPEGYTKTDDFAP